MSLWFWIKSGVLFWSVILHARKEMVEELIIKLVATTCMFCHHWNENGELWRWLVSFQKTLWSNVLLFCLSRICPVNLLRLPAMVTCVTVSSPSIPATLTQGCGVSIWSVSHPLLRTWCTLFRENGKLPSVSLKRLFLVEEYNLKRKYLKRIFFSAWACLGTKNTSNSKLWHPRPSLNTQFLALLLGVNSLRCRFCS